MNEMKPLGCNPAQLRGLSEKLIVSHYENNYAGAFKRLNQILEQLDALDFDKAPGFVINGLKREELIAMNSVILHENYFAGLGACDRPRELSEALSHDFKSIDQWQAQFAAMGRALGGGSGWVLLSYSPRSGRLINQWAADHTTTIGDGVVILRSTCMSIRITSTTARRRRPMWRIHPEHQLAGCRGTLCPCNGPIDLLPLGGICGRRGFTAARSSHP